MSIVDLILPSSSLLYTALLHLDYNVSLYHSTDQQKIVYIDLVLKIEAHTPHILAPGKSGDDETEG